VPHDTALDRASVGAGLKPARTYALRKTRTCSPAAPGWGILGVALVKEVLATEGTDKRRSEGGKPRRSQGLIGSPPLRAGILRFTPAEAAKAGGQRGCEKMSR